MKKNIKDKKENSESLLFGQRLIGLMKHLKSHLSRQYKEDFYIGSIYFGDDTITFFSFTPKEMKRQKLKIVIVYNHPETRFEIWLAGQNKEIQKKYWEIFKDSDWNRYHIPSSITGGFSIVENILIEEPDIENFDETIETIESKSLKFIKDLEEVLK